MDPGKQHPANEVLNLLGHGPAVIPIHDTPDHFEDAWEAAEVNENWAEFNEAWTQADSNDRTALRPRNMPLDEFCEMWQQMWPMEEILHDEYVFEPQNPYLNDPFAAEVATKALAEGDVESCLLALEAAVIQNPEAADLWLLIGKLNAENDEDPRAIAALSKAYEIDSYNLEAILALGISLINAKQLDNAMNLLVRWIENNAAYTHLVSLNTDLHEKVIDLYTQASNLHPDNATLFQVLGSLYFMDKEYDLAVSAFENAVGKDPGNYYCWNRLGAALAHKGDNLNAIHAYQKALELRPKYVRAWANMGIAHANLNLMVEAARIYLCALSFNPKASHVWNYLFTSFTCLSKIYIGRFDLLEKLKSFDVSLFEEEFQFRSLRDFASSNEETWSNDFIFEND